MPIVSFYGLVPEKHVQDSLQLLIQGKGHHDALAMEWLSRMGSAESMNEEGNMCGVTPDPAEAIAAYWWGVHVIPIAQEYTGNTVWALGTATSVRFGSEPRPQTVPPEECVGLGMFCGHYDITTRPRVPQLYAPELRLGWVVAEYVHIERSLKKKRKKK